MKIFNFSQNGFVKFFGIGAILYFALFNDKENPNSLGYKFSGDNLKKNLEEVKEHSSKIVKGVLIAKEINRRNMAIESSNEELDILVFDDVESFSKVKAKCNDNLLVSLEVKNEKGQTIRPEEAVAFTLGQKKFPIIERAVMNMGKSGSRIVNIPHGYKTNSTIVNELRLDKDVKNIFYRINLQNIAPSKENKYNCDE